MIDMCIVLHGPATPVQVPKSPSVAGAERLSTADDTRNGNYDQKEEVMDAVSLVE
jgi:hypothetical protein